MLRVESMSNIHDGIDISSYAKLTSFLKRQSEGYRAKKSKVFAEDEMHSFITEAPDKE